MNLFPQTLSDNSKGRQSNFEALRIVAMTMIITAHYFVVGHNHTLSTYDFVFALAPFVYVGLNVFFILSGWFGIKTTRRGLVRLLCYVFFFSAVSLVMLFAVKGGVTRPDLILYLFIAPLSSNCYWFIHVYFCLMIMAPFINAGIESVSRRTYNLIVIAISLMGVYGCWKFGNYANISGMNFFQGFWMYLVGRCLRRNSRSLLRIKRKYYFWGFLLTASLGSVYAVLSHDYTAFFNLSPFVVVGSIFLFLFFARLSFTSTAVNRLAACTLSCYLFHEGFFSQLFYYEEIGRRYAEVTATWGRLDAILYVCADYLAMVLVCWLAAWLLTPLANRFFSFVLKASEPLHRRLSRFISERFASADE